MTSQSSQHQTYLTKRLIKESPCIHHTLFNTFNPVSAATQGGIGALSNVHNPSGLPPAVPLLVSLTTQDCHFLHSFLLLCTSPRWPSGMVCATTAADRGTEPQFLRSSYTSDLHIGTLMTRLPGAWRYSVSARTGWPEVSIL